MGDQLLDFFSHLIYVPAQDTEQRRRGPLLGILILGGSHSPSCYGRQYYSADVFWEILLPTSVVIRCRRYYSINILSGLSLVKSNRTHTSC